MSNYFDQMKNKERIKTQRQAWSDPVKSKAHDGEKLFEVYNLQADLIKSLGGKQPTGQTHDSNFNISDAIKTRFDVIGQLVNRRIN
jgi:hypothetical protein